MMKKASLIFQHDELVVKSVPFGKDVCVVTFDSYTDNRTVDRPGFAESFLRSRHIDALHFIARDNDWWQYPFMEEALAAAHAYLSGYRRVITYGTSMGAYAAIRFADAVGAQSVFASAPQYSIDPEQMDEVRWAHDSQRIRFLPHLDGRISCSAKVFVLYDPQSQDNDHFQRIRQDIPVQSIRFPYAGHSVLACLQECGALSKVLEELIHDDPDVLEIERMLHEKRDRSPTYLASLTERIPASRPRTRIALARKALALGPTNLLAISVLAELLESTGAYEEAFEHRSRAVDLSNRAFPHLHSLSRTYSRAGQPDKAMELAQECLKIAPEHGLSHYWIGHLHAESGRYEMALPYLEKALSIEPDNALYKTTLNYIGNMPPGQKRNISKLKVSTRLLSLRKKLFDKVSRMKLPPKP